MVNKTVTIDGRNSKDKRELHLHIKEVMDFPAYYGCNLDALYDCLTDVNEATDIFLIHGDALEENLNEYAVRLFHTFREAAENNPHLKIHLVS